MALEGLAFIGFATFPGWHEEHDARTGEDIDIKPFPSWAVAKGVTLTTGMASLMTLVSALWQHVAAASAAMTIESLTQGKVVGHVGAAAVGLIWVSFALMILVFVGILVMILGIHRVNSLIEA